MRKIRAGAASALIAIVCTAARAEVSCPDQLTVEQRAQPPNGWDVRYRDSPMRLAAVAFFDGPPANRASIRYAARRREGRELILRWRLPETPRSQYVQCAYERTTAIISRALPPGMHTCEVVFDTRSSLTGGGMAVKRMVCR